MKELLKKMIAQYLLDIQGCKLTELITKISVIVFSKDYHSYSIDMNDIQVLLTLLEFYDSENHIETFEEVLTETIDEMINNKEIVPVIYTLPNIQYREKLFLLPKGTIIK